MLLGEGWKYLGIKGEGSHCGLDILESIGENI